MMKPSLVLFVALLLLSLGSTPAYADSSGKVMASVSVNSHPAITVAPKTPIISAGAIQTGEFFVTVVYSIGANLQRVSMFLEASDLFKSDDPNNQEIDPIKLNTGKPAEIATQFGHRTNGQASWTTSGNPIGSHRTVKTETLTYESTQSGHSSQDVTCRIWYRQSDPNKTAGQYSGRVRLTVFMTP